MAQAAEVAAVQMVATLSRPLAQAVAPDMSRVSFLSFLTVPSLSKAVAVARQKTASAAEPQA
jgi:hypothetical protein